MRWTLGAAGIMCAAMLASLAPGGEVTLNGHLFTLPDGLEIEQVADPSLVMRPICADFDEHGRLYVADSSGSNDPVAEQLEEKPHRIVCLEDTNGDRRFDKSTDFADRMMFPEGVLWHRGSLYVAAPPSIWKLTDTDGDNVADQREEWFEGKTLTGCANDLHGPYLGPDGWIYWCKGAFAAQTYERPGKPPLETRAAHIFRRHPTEGWIEPVMTGGMDNPVEIAFSAAGERFFTTTFLQHPGGGRRDGIIHAIYGGVYGKVHNVIDGHPRTGDIMPVLTHMGPAAPCGLTRLISDGLGEAYRDNLLACSFNMHKVTRHVLRPNGATFETEDHDLLVSENVDFHPTDVLEDADGSVLVVDTGGWYKICCPTSHLYKPDVLGAIYRIRRTGANIAQNARGSELNWKAGPRELVRRLEDGRFAVRQRAIGSLAEIGASAVSPLRELLRSSRNPVARNDAVWALARIDHSAARAALRAAAGDQSETVRQAAMHGLGLWRDPEALDRLCEVLGTGTMADRRVAAEALGRIGDARAVPFLVAAASADNDRALEHSLIFALIEIGDAGALQAVGKQEIDQPAAQRAILIALDQIDPSQSSPSAAKLLDSSNALLRDTAMWLVDRHPEWGGELSDYLVGRLMGATLDGPSAAELEQQLARFAAHPAIQQRMRELLVDSDAPPHVRPLVIRAMRQVTIAGIPAGWLEAVTVVLQEQDPALVADAVGTLRAWRARGVPLDALREPLIQVAQRPDLPSETKLDALAALPRSDELPAALLPLVLEYLQPQQPIEQRLRAADILASARLAGPQLQQVIDQLQQLGPMELGRILPLFAETTEDDIGRSLIAALKQNPSIGGIPIPTLKTNLSKFGPAVQQQAERLYAELDAEISAQQAHFEQLLSSLEQGDEGDIRRGQAVFYGRKAACSTCHAIGYLGGDIGPDLTRIAQIRAPRDLLEAIVFPSASFVRSYEPVVVVTTDGQVHNGVLRSDAPDEITIATGADKFVTIPRDAIDELQPSKVSIMPAGLDKQLTRQELADLLAFLKASK